METPESLLLNDTVGSCCLFKCEVLRSNVRKPRNSLHVDYGVSACSDEVVGVFRSGRAVIDIFSSG